MLVGLVALLLSSNAWAAGGVAVLYFQNEGNVALEPLKVGLAQMLVTDLTTDSDLPIIERSQLQAALDEFKLGHDGIADPVSAARVGKLVGAQYFVMGTYFELFGTLRIDTRIVEVETGRIVFAYGTNSPTSAFLTMEKDVSAALRSKLDSLQLPKAKTPSGTRSTEGASVVAPPAATAVASTTVVTTERHTLDAAVAYSEGLIHLDQRDLPRAREAFEKAVAADPQLEAARAELSQMTL